MPSYDGVVTLAEDDIPVIVELDDDTIRLSASGTEIGLWPKSECEIRHLGNSTYVIEAEDETLSFVPSEPTLFAAAVSGESSSTYPHTPEPVVPAQPPTADRPDADAPPPQAMTMGLFYALCTVTVGLAIWSIISIIL
jgi:hypothetical protein